jgi:hypothetical protein
LILPTENETQVTPGNIRPNTPPFHAYYLATGETELISDNESLTITDNLPALFISQTS